MLFNSYAFILAFLPLSVLGFYAVRRAAPQASKLWLVACSLFFYGYWNPAYLFLICTSICVNYTIGSALIARPSRPLFILGTFFNLGLLSYYKYADFFVTTYNEISGARLHLDHIVLPLAISFFTFQQISFLLDAYRGNITESPFLDYCLFVTFFPQLIAGPIVHHQELLPQFKNHESATIPCSRIVIGGLMFAVGLFKKTIIADSLGLLVDPIYANAELGVGVPSAGAWVATFTYGFQIYYDFSGYADMTVGLGLMFGVRLPFNFNSPYKATNLFDFWRRWHMTLTRFIYTHLYQPLVENTRLPMKPMVAVMISMTLGGLWHGGKWTLVLWGFAHAVLLACNHLWNRVAPAAARQARRSKVLTRLLDTPLPTVAAVVLTFSVAVISRVLFRAETMDGAGRIYESMVGNGAVDIPYTLSYVQVLGLAAVCGLTWLMPNSQQIFSRYETGLDPLANRQSSARRSARGRAPVLAPTRIAFEPSARWALALGVVGTIAFVGVGRTSAFIYFNF